MVKTELPFLLKKDRNKAADHRIKANSASILHYAYIYNQLLYMALVVPYMHRCAFLEVKTII